MLPSLKNKLLLLALVFCLSQASRAQSYHPFITSDTLTWNILFSGDQDYYDFQKIMAGDTVIGHRQYMELIGGRILDTVFVREANKRVFFRSNSAYFKDTGEYVLYDFNLQPGDTFNYISYAFRSHFPVHLTLVTIDSIQLDKGQYRKHFQFDATSSQLEHQTERREWIEGMGDIANPVYMEDVFAGWGHNYVTCFFDGDTVLWHSDFWYPGYCNRRVSIKQQESRHLSINLYPNPSTDLLHIDGLPNAINESCYQVVNMKGLVVQRGKLSNSSPYLNISGLKNGIYRLEINTESTRYNAGFIKD
jgi:hypothetical protein